MAENIRLLWILWMSVRIHLSAAVPQINCTAGQPVEGKPYQLFCTGINAASKVEWRRSFQGGGGDGVVASCDDVSICIVIDNTQHGVSRPTANTSSLTILRIQRNDDTRWTWTCLSGGQSSSCNLPPTIYLPELSTNCTAELTLGGPVARCLIQKVYPVPECTWLESITPLSGAGESNTTILPSSSEVQLEALASFHTADGNLYFNATCVLRRIVTYIEGNYSYTAIVSPGSVSRIVKFAGRSSIAAPSTPALVDCGSGYIPPSQEVVCTCRVSDLGWPRGHVMWTDQSGNVIRTGQNTSVQLVRGDVPEPKSTNRTYECQVRSSDNFIHSTDYVPFFAFGPDTVRITGPNTLIADDHSSVTLTCTAYGVNPQPFFIWQGQGQDFLVSSVSGGDESQSYQESMSFVPRLTEKSVVVTCFVRNSHFNLSYVSNSSFTIPFIRNNCSFDSGESSESKGLFFPVAASVSGVLGLGCLVLSVTVVVLCCRSRKQKKLDKKGDKTFNFKEFEVQDEASGKNKLKGQTPSPTPHTFRKHLPQVWSQRDGVSSPEDTNLYNEIESDGQAPQHPRAVQTDSKGYIPMDPSADRRQLDTSQQTGDGYERLRQPAPGATANSVSTSQPATKPVCRDSSPQTLAPPPPPPQGQSKVRQVLPMAHDQSTYEQLLAPPKAHTPDQSNNMYLQAVPDEDASAHNHSLTAGHLHTAPRSDSPELPWPPIPEFCQSVPENNAPQREYQNMDDNKDSAPGPDNGPN